ncbi:ATP-binding cassette domain-containing protein [Alcaligenaceae bacterium]|nr:ATP-binding cassette domain-containing protein [Alcaligenaceae bacterium]
MLTISNINLDLAGNRILRDINVSFKRATTVGIVGHNGAGKTTLLRTIMGLITPVSGQIVLGDTDLTKKPPYTRTADGIGYAPENRVIFPSMTVRENMMMPCQVLGLSKSAIEQRFELVLDTVPELTVMLDRSGAALSGGQGKMVALGRALMVGTSLLLLDEPFQGLAPRLAQVYTEALSRLKVSQPDLCVVITESNVKLLSDIPDQIWTIERGSIQLNANTEE